MTAKRVTLEELDRAQLMKIARDYVGHSHTGGEAWAAMLDDAEVLDAARKVLLDVAEMVVRRERRPLTRLYMLREEDGGARLLFEFSDGTLFATPPTDLKG